MRRVLATATVGLGLIAPTGAGASHGDSGNGERDFAVGAGGSELFLGAVGEASFTLSASSDPFGVRPAGYVTSRGDPDGPGPVAPFTARGEVTCLRVDGNRASIKWRFENAAGTAAPLQGGGVQSFVEDNGEPRFGQPVDRALIDPPQPAATFEANAYACEDPDNRVTYDRLEQGNITVHDAAAP